MRTSLAVVLFAALALTAAGQPPKVDPKANPKPDMKAPAKADAKAAANTMPAAGTPTYPTTMGGKNLDKWIQEIDDPDPSHRVLAIDTVLYFGPTAKKAIPALAKQVKSSIDQAPRAHAIYALGQLVPLDVQSHGRDAIDALSFALDNNQGTIRIQACRSIAAIGPAARVTVAKLVRLVEDRISNEVRQAAAYALGRVAYDESGSPDPRALNALIGGIDDISREVRLECLQSITNLGPPAAGGAAPIKEKLERRIKSEKDNSAKIWVRVALMRMDATKINDANLNPIAALMKEKDDLDIRIQAARAIGFIGPQAKSKVPELTAALQDPEALMQWQALWSLARMGKDAKSALPQIEKIANDDKADRDVREAAKKTIEEINKK